MARRFAFGRSRNLTIKGTDGAGNDLDADTVGAAIEGNPKGSGDTYYDLAAAEGDEADGFPP